MGNDVSVLFLPKINCFDPSDPSYCTCVSGLVLRMRLGTCMLTQNYAQSPCLAIFQRLLWQHCLGKVEEEKHLVPGPNTCPACSGVSCVDVRIHRALVCESILLGREWTPDGCGERPHVGHGK